MKSAASDSLVVFRIEEHNFAVEVSAVERVVRAVEITPLPDAPRGVRGVINLQGRIVPVFDVGSRLGYARRELRASQHFLIVRTHWRVVALLADAVRGVVPRLDAQLTPTAAIFSELASISGVLKLNGGIVLVHDVEQFLSSEDHTALQLALDHES